MDESRLILMIEDSEDDIFFMKRAFKAAGIINPLKIIEDGQHAIDYLSGNGEFSDREQFPLPSLILLDLKLPYKNGLEILEWIKRQLDLREIIVIVLTSSKETSDIDKAYKLGANSYLVKPPTAENLLEMTQALKLYWIHFNSIGVDPNGIPKGSLEGGSSRIDEG